MWKSIHEPPAEPTEVLFHSMNLTFMEYGTDEIVQPSNHEKFSIGYWDGRAWVWSMTNHEVFEFGDKPGDDDRPTHWMPLPRPPETQP